MRGPAFPLLATCAQEICVSNNTEKKEVVSDKCHKVSFIFLISDIQNADYLLIAFSRRPAELPFSRNGDTFSRLGHANIRAAEHEALPIHAQWCTSRSSAPIIVEHVGLRTLLNDAALFQIAQDATDVLARQPSGDGLYA